LGEQQRLGSDGLHVYRSSSANGTFVKINASLLTTAITTTRPRLRTDELLSCCRGGRGQSGIVTPATRVGASSGRVRHTPRLRAPSGVTATAPDGRKLDWANNSEDDLAGYNIYRSSSANGTFAN